MPDREFLPSLHGAVTRSRPSCGIRKRCRNSPASSPGKAMPIVSMISPRSCEATTLSSAAFIFWTARPDNLIGAVRQARVPRYVVVGGAGSLDNGSGVKLIDAGGVPEPYKAESRAGCNFLDTLRQTSDLDWTFLSPSAQFVAGRAHGRLQNRSRHRPARCRRAKLDLLRGLRRSAGRRDRAAAPFQAPLHGWLLT